MTACALPRFMFTWVPSGNVRLTPESMSQDSDRGAGLSVAIGRNRLPESSDKGGIGSPMPSCRQSRRRFLASFTDSPLFSIHRFILPCLTLHLFRKKVRVAVGLWDSSFKNAFHTLSYRFAAVILVILYSCGKGKELKDAEQGCIADTLTAENSIQKLLLQLAHNAGSMGFKRQDVYEGLQHVFPSNLTHDEKLRKIGRLLGIMSKEGLISKPSTGKKWNITEKGESELGA